MVPCASRPTPRRKARDVSPMQSSCPAANASEYPMMAHDDADESERDEAHHHRVQRVLRADQSAIEERQRRRHEQDKGSRDEHPSGIGLIHCVHLVGPVALPQTLRTRGRGVSVRPQSKPETTEGYEIGGIHETLTNIFVRRPSRLHATYCSFGETDPADWPEADTSVALV